jgi:hypothetical protein
MESDILGNDSMTPTGRGNGQIQLLHGYFPQAACKKTTELERNPGLGMRHGFYRSGRNYNL